MFGRRKRIPIVEETIKPVIKLNQNSLDQITILFERRKDLTRKLSQLKYSIDKGGYFTTHMTINLLSGGKMQLDSGYAEPHIRDKICQDVISTYKMMLEDVDRQLREFGILITDEQ